MQAVVLAAGLGRRLEPLTRTLPKPALPVVGRPMVRQILRRLGAGGFDEVAVNLHHLGPRLARAVEDFESLGIGRLHLSEEAELLGTGGGIRRCVSYLPEAEPAILVHNGDCLHDIDLAEVVAAHHLSGRDATWVLAPWRPGYTRVRAEQGRIAAIGDPAGEHLFTGCHVLSRRRIEDLPLDEPSDVIRDLYREAVSAGRVGASVHEGFWWEFGTRESFLDGCLELIGLPPDTRAEIAETDPVEAIGSAQVASGEGVRLGAGAHLEGLVALGAGSRLHDCVRLRDTVVMAEVEIGGNVTLDRTLIGPGVVVPSDSRWSDRVVAVTGDGDLRVEPLKASS